MHSMVQQGMLMTHVLHTQNNNADMLQKTCCTPMFRLQTCLKHSVPHAAALQTYCCKGQCSDCNMMCTHAHAYSHAHPHPPTPSKHRFGSARAKAEGEGAPPGKTRLRGGLGRQSVDMANVQKAAASKGRAGPTGARLQDASPMLATRVALVRPLTHPYFLSPQPSSPPRFASFTCVHALGEDVENTGKSLVFTAFLLLYTRYYGTRHASEAPLVKMPKHWYLQHC